MPNKPPKILSKAAHARARFDQLRRREARAETRMFKRQEKLIKRICERRRIQLLMYRNGIKPMPGWIEDLWDVRQHKSIWEQPAEEEEDQEEFEDEPAIRAELMEKLGRLSAALPTKR